MLLGILALIGKIFDFFNPWSKKWAEDLSEKAKSKKEAQSKMDEATDKGDWNAYDKARADKHSSD